MPTWIPFTNSNGIYHTGDEPVKIEDDWRMAVYIGLTILFILTAMLVAATIAGNP